jgi:hypothetical protein
MSVDMGTIGFADPAAPSPISPPAQLPTMGLILTRRITEALPGPSRPRRSEPVLKSPGYTLYDGSGCLTIRV